MANSPAVLLDGVTSAGPGPAYDLRESLSIFHTILWSVGANGSSLILDGSHDGVHWVALGAGGQLWDTPLFASVSGMYVRYIRGRVTNLAPGANPITMTVIAA